VEIKEPIGPDCHERRWRDPLGLGESLWDKCWQPSTNVKYFRSFSNRTKHGTQTSLTRFPAGLYKNRRKDVDRVNSLLSYHIWDKQVDVICTCNGRLSVNLFVV